MARRAAESAPSAKGAGAWTRKTLPRLILVIGPESALREEGIERIRTAAFGDDKGGMNWVVMHGPLSASEADALTPAAFLDETCTASMFAAEDELKVVLVRQADLFLTGKDYREIVDRNQEKIPETSTLVLEAAAYGQLKTTNFFKNLEKSGAVVLCESLAGKFGDSQELEIEIEKRARQRKLQLTHGAMVALLERSTRNLGVIEEELDKLALALQKAGAGADSTETIHVTEEDVAEFCASTRTYSAFNFADALMERDAKRALEVLGAIFDRGIGDAAKPGKIITNDGSIAMLILGALTYKLTQMQDFQALLDSGKGEYEAFGVAKIFGFRQEAFKRTQKKHSGASLRRAMNALFRANLDLRRGGARAQEVLEELVWGIARS